jgi:hypothetical protein
MATARGRVFRLNWQSDIVCAMVGATASNTELLTVQFLSSDSRAEIEYKRGVVKLLTIALCSRRSVSVFHSDNDSRITGMAFDTPNISPVGPPIHNDFYAITGSNFPDNLEVVFQTPALSIALTPDFQRPFWVLLEQLSPMIPAGPCEVFLRAPGWESDRMPVIVSNRAPLTVRTLYPGRPTMEPYTFIFAANPAIEPPLFVAGNAPVTDPVLSDRTAFHDVVRHCLTNLLTLTESLLRTDNFEANIRFVSIFDRAAEATAANTLVGRVSPNLIEPLRERLNSFVGRYWENPDIVFCISGNSGNTRASAWFTTDDNSRAGVSFTYDGTTPTHRRYTDIPGSAAISTFMDTTGLTAIHEFGHAASDFNNGMVIDLYVDGTRTGFVVNKKMRVRATDSIPNNFGSYGTTTFQSDQNRDGLGYPATWRSYHPALVDTTRPNLMDNYWNAASQPQQCRLDGLTFNWFADRLRAKILR